jgi:hypothetical protein
MPPGRQAERKSMLGMTAGPSTPGSVATTADATRPLPIRWRGDEDGNLGRGGSLERDQPIFLLIETLRHRRFDRFGVRTDEVRERRAHIW